MDLAVTSFLLGLLSTSNPCVLPLYPGFLAYLSGQTTAGMGRQRYLLGPWVLAGVLTMMLALGGLIALLAVPISKTMALVVPLADFLILLLGVFLLFNRNPFKSLPQLQAPVLRHPFLNAYIYGLLYGPLTMPCSGPLVVSIFAVSLTVEEALGKLWVFVWFGLGFGAPLVALSFLSATFQRQLTIQFARHTRLMNSLGGLLLIGIALYDVSQNWDLLRLFY